MLAVLSDLSLKFQDDTGAIPDTLKAYETACLQLVALKQRQGENLQHFLDTVDNENCFLGVQLTQPEQTDEHLKKKQDALDAVIDHVIVRIGNLDTSDLLKDMQVFFLLNMPGTDAELAVYGENKIDSLCTHYAPVLTLTFAK